METVLLSNQEELLQNCKELSENIKTWNKNDAKKLCDDVNDLTKTIAIINSTWDKELSLEHFRVDFLELREKYVPKHLSFLTECPGIWAVGRRLVCILNTEYGTEAWSYDEACDEYEVYYNNYLKEENDND